MKFPRYWTRVTNQSGTLVAKGWSETSQEEAQANAESRLQRIGNALKNGIPLDHYPYVADHVICEEVIDRIFDGDQEIAVVSRNSYGSLIMNTKILLFADVDIIPQLERLITPNKFIRWVASKLLAKSFVSQEIRSQLENAHIEVLRQWQKNHAEYSLRVYQTFAGLRVMITNQVIPKIDEQVLTILRQWQSDPRFEQLCKVQQCFRARLTPKPWRIQMEAPPSKFPFKTNAEEHAFHDWFDRYISKCQPYRVCRFVETIGSGEIDSKLLPLIEQHDALCGIEKELPLA